MKEFFAYLKSKRKALCFFLITGALLSCSFALYRLPVMAVLYPFMLSALLGFLFLLFDYGHTQRKCRELKRLAQQPPEMATGLPETDTQPEAAWKALTAHTQEALTAFKAESRKEYEEAVDYFTVWAHQIKTPIAAMKLTLQNDDTEQARQLRSDLFRTQQYADMVLAFLRLGSDSTDHVFRLVPLDEVVRPSVRKFAPEFIHRHLALRYGPLNASAVTDEKWLAFVLEQLLSNALKYTKEGSISIAMADERTLRVSDTGIGIAPEDLPRIFEKGYTGINGRLDKSASGLGLYLCKRVCGRLCVDLRITSRLGEGTQVFLTFPEKSPMPE